MATSGKFDMSSASPDRPLYISGQRGSHLASDLDRSGSFREGMETPMLSSLSNVTRSSSTVDQEDIVNFFQCLRFDPKKVAANHKSSRPGDFKRNMDVALGISMDEYGFLKGKMLTSCIPEEIKRVKTGLREGSVRARERVKIFNEALSVFNKFFPSVLSKKRSRLEGFSGDRASGLLSSDRPAMALGVGKMGFQNHVVVTSSDLEQPKLGERTRNAFPNKRTRTSLVDARSNSQVKSSGTVDRDREMPRPMNSSTIQAEDRANLAIGVDGWEKSKMKKKRSGIKPDVSASVAATKLTDSYREPKPGIQQKPVTDSRSRMNVDSHGLRLGVTNDAVSVGKSDGVVQSTNLNVRPSIPRADPEFVAFPSDKKDRHAGSDKDRVNFKAINKANMRDEFNSATPTSSTKMNATVRAPRSGAGAAPKSSPLVPRATAPNDSELSQCTNRPAALGAKNRKRSAANRSSSPPVAHWAGQRPQKISRTARRTNLMSILPNNDEAAQLDDVSDVSGNEIGVESTVRLTTNSPQQVKMKVEPSSATLSESEESGALDKKSKEKGKMSEGTDDKGGQCVQKLLKLGMAPRKNKLFVKEDVGDGVRRQGRTGRGFTSTRSVASVRVEKLGNVGTAKHLRSAKLGFDKTESKPGRPPTRKLSNCKAYKRQKHAMANVFAEFHGGSDDGNEELLAAASSVANPDNAACSPFWREMEPIFGFIFDDDIAYLKQQVNIELPSPIPSDINNCRIVHNGCESVEDEWKGGLPNETSSLELQQKSMPGARDISLFQRLIMAIIPEDDSIHGSGDMELEACTTGFEPDEESESDSLANHDSFQFAGRALNLHKPFGKPGKDEAELGLMEIPAMSANSIFSPSANGLLTYQSMIPRIFPSELLYDDQQINEKLHSEIQSIGISIEPMPNLQVEDGAIVEEISSLEEIFCDQALKKTSLLDKLLKSSSEAKELQEKEFHERAHDKLVAMAYEKYLGCRGPHAMGGKSSSNKMAKQAAMAIVKRTLEQCHMFEDTGKSCFSEPLVREIFLKRSSHQKGVGLDNLENGDSPTLYVNGTSRSNEARISASSTHPSPQTSRLGRNAENDIAYSPDLFPHIGSHLSDQDTNKEDPWSNRMKKRELLLDDVGGGLVGNSPTVSSGIGGTLSSSIKGKRSERDREGKGHNREVVSRGGTNKNGRPALSNVKGERNSKAKPKQKTAQLSVSVNGPVGKIPEHPKPALPSEPMSSGRNTNSSSTVKDELALDVLDDPEDIVFSNLVGIDDDVQGNDLGSWLNIDDDGLQDHDFMGLEIPMDDLADLNMMV